MLGIEKIIGDKIIKKYGEEKLRNMTQEEIMKLIFNEMYKRGNKYEKN